MKLASIRDGFPDGGLVVVSRDLRMTVSAARIARPPRWPMASTISLHTLRERGLCAGTIIGSGTISTASFRDTGSCCIAERRAIEMIDFGAPRTAFLSFGERVRMEARIAGSAHPLFGAIGQTVVGGART